MDKALKDGGKTPKPLYYVADDWGNAYCNYCKNETAIRKLHELREKHPELTLRLVEKTGNVHKTLYTF